MKTIIKLLLCWLLIIGYFSCKTPVSDVAGTYLSLFEKSRKPHKGLDIYTAHKFVFNTDSTFNYFYIVIGDAEKYSSGTWKQINKNTIVLNSDIQSTIIPLHIEVTPSDNKNPMINVKLIVPGKDEKEYRCIPQYALIGNYYVENFLPDRGSYSYDETNYYSNDHELFFKVSKEPFGLIPGRGRIKYYILETEHKTITMNDGDIVNVTVTVQDSLFSYRVFNSEKIKINNNNKLIFNDNEEKNKTNKLYLYSKVIELQKRDKHYIFAP